MTQAEGVQQSSEESTLLVFPCFSCIIQPVQEADAISKAKSRVGGASSRPKM